MENQSEKLDHQVAGLPSLCLASSRIQIFTQVGRRDVRTVISEIRQYANAQDRGRHNYQHH